MTSTPRIAVAGHLCLDVVPDLGRGADLTPGALLEIGPLSVDLGGCVANTGGVLRGLGAEVVAFAAIGDDELGDLLRAKLAARGFDPSQLTTIAGGSTSYSLVIERPGTDRTFWHHSGANAGFDGGSVAFDGTDILHLGYPPLLPALLVDDGAPLRTLLARAGAAGITTSVDLAVVDPASPAGRLDWDAVFAAIAPHTDLLSPSLDDLTSALGIDETFSVELVDRLATRFLDLGVAVIAISAGREGLFVRTASATRLRAAGVRLAAVAESWADRVLHVAPVHAGPLVTTTGAGDASTAGLLFGLATGTSLDAAAQLAADCSAAVLAGARTAGT